MTAITSTKGMFLLVMLIGSGLYTAVAFDLESTTTAGRIGPGFFPRIIGVLLVITAGWALVSELTGRTAESQGPQEQDPQAAASAEQPSKVGDTLLMIGLIVAFVPLLLYLGALIGMVLFTLVTLFLFNRGRPLLNVLIGVVFPLALFLLFDRGLNATLPRGAFDLIPF
ncbi:MAG: tripartite tricarboxylate transporter TctB family protein [Actinomycetota bacterium]|nr:tripartite tricarboxylate transporter TctB family protein [Actinomycetota bacterium]